MLLYSLLYLTGYEDMTLDQIKNFRQLGSIARPVIPNTVTPPASRPRPVRLGQGFGNSVGFALANVISTQPSATMLSTTTPMCWPAMAA
jgi:transketolase